MTWEGLNNALSGLQEGGLSDLVLDTPWVLLLIIPWLLVVVRQFADLSRRAHLGFPRMDLMKRLPKGRNLYFFHLGRTFWWIGGLLLVITLARPRILAPPAPSETQGIDMVVVLDVSGSMKAADFKPKDRLHVAKSIIKKHLLTRRSDRIGLVVFAGQAYTQSPLTHDKEMLAEILDGIRTGVIEDGTAIGDATATGVNRLRESKAKGKALILITDGDNNAGSIDPLKAAELAKAFEIQIFSILVGKGGKVPYPVGKDMFGRERYQEVEWPTNPSLLQRMAKTSDGNFFSATAPRELETSLQEILAAMDQSVLEGAAPSRKRIDLYPLFLLFALLLLFSGQALLTTRGSSLP